MSMSADPCSYEYWLGPRQVKYSSSGVERSVRPGATIRRASAVLDIIGVTKVADVTDLDRVGIPNFMTVRPHDLGPGISYYNGKGTTRAAAHAGALMEAIERHAGERYDGRVIATSHYNLRSEHPCVDPLEIHVPMIRKYSEHLMLEWVLGFDLMTRRPTYAPLNCVVAPYDSDSGMALFYTSTNGLASGNTRVDAVCHALVRGDRTGCDRAGHGKGRRQARRCGDCWRISDSAGDVGGARRGAADIASRIAPSRGGAGPQAAASRARGGAARSDVGDRHRDHRLHHHRPARTAHGMNAHSGCGTHPDARIALTRALTEAAQSRLTCIQGGREDLPDFVPARGRRRWSRSTAAAIPSVSTISRPISIHPSTTTSNSSSSGCGNPVLSRSLSSTSPEGRWNPRRARDCAAIGGLDDLFCGWRPGESGTSGVAGSRVTQVVIPSSTTDAPAR